MTPSRPPWNPCFALVHLFQNFGRMKSRKLLPLPGLTAAPSTLLGKKPLPGMASPPVVLVKQQGPLRPLQPSWSRTKPTQFPVQGTDWLAFAHVF